jgi:histone H3/H4
MTLRKIKKFQKNINLLFFKVLFQRLICKIIIKMKFDIQVQNTTMIIIQEVAQIFAIMILKSWFEINF